MAIYQWVKMRWEQRKIEKAKSSISSRRKAAEKKARASGASPDELHDLGYNFHMEQVAEDEQMTSLTSDFYVRLAHRLLVPVPEFKKDGTDWEESLINGAYRLSPRALHDLRGAIREELKARREQWTVWFSLFFGAIGALSAVLALTLTSSSIDLNRHSIEVSHRPFVTVKGVSFENIYKVGANPGVTLVLHNTGQSPALGLKVYWTLRFSEEDLRPGPMPTQDIVPKSVAILAPSVDITVPIASQKIVTSEVADALKSHKIRIYIFGRLVYEDIFGAAHLTEYCFEPDLNTGYGTACSQWNTLN